MQELIDKALSTVLREQISTTGCGRTDTGVHARQFFAHFDVNNEVNISDLASVNSLLPYDIAVKRFIPVDAKAHARFDAVSRTYEYHICFEKDPFRHEFATFLHFLPDVDEMNRAAGLLTGTKDYGSFSKAHTQVKTNLCTVTRAQWEQKSDGLIFYISADRFLRNMVRAIVGTLLDIGKGITKTEQLEEIINSKNRSNAGMSVPACGLYLTKIEYPYLS